MDEAMLAVYPCFQFLFLAKFTSYVFELISQSRSRHDKLMQAAALEDNGQHLNFTKCPLPLRMLESRLPSLIGPVSLQVSTVWSII